MVASHRTRHMVPEPATIQEWLDLVALGKFERADPDCQIITMFDVQQWQSEIATLPPKVRNSHMMTGTLQLIRSYAIIFQLLRREGVEITEPAKLITEEDDVEGQEDVEGAGQAASPDEQE